MRLKDELGPLYQNEALLAPLFPLRVRPAELPWRLALVTVQQALVTAREVGYRALEEAVLANIKNLSEN
jgi:hypothetical protein